MYYFGFDIGASSIKAVLVKDKAVIDSKFQDSPDSLEKLGEALVRLKNELIGEKSIGEISGIGVGVAGILDKERQAVIKSPNIPYLDNQPLKKILEEHFKPLPVKIEHDVHCFLMAEKETGQAKDFKNIFYLTLGSGIGGAWMFEGKIVYGDHGSAGEAGHMIIDVCQGLKFEELAANKFIMKSLGVGSLEAEQRILKGNDEAHKVMRQLGTNLGIGIANIINILDPEAVVLSGGISWAESLIMPKMKEAINKYVVSPAAKETKVFFSGIGRYGGALGATLLFENK